MQELSLPPLNHAPSWLIPKPEFTLRFKHVYHIGELDGSPQVNGNMEGPLLSVSLHPDQWRRHARLESPSLWKLQKKKDQLLFLDIERFHWKKPHPHALWAIHEGLIVQESPSKFAMTPKLRAFWHQRQKTDWNMHDPLQVEVAVISIALCYMRRLEESCYDGVWWKTSASPVCPIPRGGMVPHEKILYRIISP